MNRSFFRFAFANGYVFLAVCGSSVLAQEQPRELAESIAPFLDAETVAVGHVDLERLDVANLVNFAVDVAQPDDGDRQQVAKLQNDFELWVKQLRDAGARHIFLVVSVADLPNSQPFIVAPIRDGAVSDRIGWLIRKGPDAATEGSPPSRRQGDLLETMRLTNNALIVSSQKTIDRVLKHRQSDSTKRDIEQLASAFAAAPDAAMHLAIIPSDDHRRVLREMLPRLDWPLEGVSGEMLADGLQWGVIGLDSNAPALRAVVQSQDGIAAARFVQGVQRGLALAARLEEVREIFPDPQQVLGVLQPQLAGNRLVWNLDNENGDLGKVVSQVFAPPIRAARAAALRQQRMNRFKQIALAHHNYHDVNKSFPPQAIRSEDGKPLLSWRVTILPYIEQIQLYEQFHLDEPWDSPHNLKLAEQMPEIFADSELPQLASENKTTIQVPVHEATVYPPGGDGTPFKEIRDGTSNTIMFAEVTPDRAVVWTKPADLQVDPANPLAGVKRTDRNTFTAALCDGSVHVMSNDIDAKVLWALLTRDGRETVQ